MTWSDVNEQKGFMVWDDETNKVTKCCSELPPRFISRQMDNLVVDASEDLTNCFVRVVGTPQFETIEEVRKGLLDKGALTVEFNMTPMEPDEAKTAALKHGFKVFDSLHHIERVEETVDPQRKVVGQKLRGLDYVRPDQLGEFN
jgi:hypothetical protein